MSYGLIRAGEEAELADIQASAFVVSNEHAMKWLERSGSEHLRVLRSSGRVVAGLVQIPMGHFIGGAPVPTVGIAGVAVALDARGESAAKSLMKACIREVASSGAALSTLYPSTQTLYRSVGYERAGKTAEYSIPLTNLECTASDEGLRARRLTDEDRPQVEAMYRAVAIERHGSLDRGPYMWTRIYDPYGRVVRGFGFFDEGELEAYVYLSQQRPDPLALRHDLWATDLQSRSARGYAAIFKFVRHQRSLAENLELYGVPCSPLLDLMKENRYDETAGEDWMVRVCDAKAALEQRGYPSMLKVEVAFRLHDELLPDNDGVFCLRVEDGRATVERGGEAEASLDVRALAPLYTGYAAPRTLARFGALEASERALRVLTAIFAAPTPAMADRF